MPFYCTSAPDLKIVDQLGWALLGGGHRARSTPCSTTTHTHSHTPSDRPRFLPAYLPMLHTCMLSLGIFSHNFKVLLWGRVCVEKNLLHISVQFFNVSFWTKELHKMWWNSGSQITKIGDIWMIWMIFHFLQLRPHTSISKIIKIGKNIKVFSIYSAWNFPKF